MAPLLAALALGALASAQRQEQGCVLRVVTAPGTRSHYSQTAPGVSRLDVGGGLEATCGDAWMRADSASYHEGPEILYLIGRVEYRDSTRTLQARRVTYHSAEERMVADGNVRLTARASGSTLTGPVVHYWPPTDARPTERLFAPQRSRLTLYPERSVEERAPLEVEGDRIYLRGDSAIAVAGGARATQPDFDASADSMNVDFGANELWLLGSPQVVAEGTTLRGDTLRGELREREIERVEAWPNAHATSEEYALHGDSIDALMPNQQLREVIAVRHAIAEAFNEVAARDSVTPKDWVSGDTIVGHFEPKMPESQRANGDASRGVELKSLVATGDARALYHVSDRSRPHLPPAINYVRGARVRVLFAGGEVTEARVDGPSIGVYAEPREAPSDSVAEDTLRAATPDTLPPRTPKPAPDPGRPPR